MTAHAGTWRRPNRLLTFLVALLSARSTPAEKLGNHVRAANPVLNDYQVKCVTEMVRQWVVREQEIAAEYAYAASQGEPAARTRYLDDRSGAARNFRHCVMRQIARSCAEHHYWVPVDEVEAFFEIATCYKDWAVRRNMRLSWQHSGTPLARARWYFINFLVTWQRQQ